MPKQKMRFGLNMLLNQPHADLVKCWKAAEDAGIHMLGLPDNPARQRELYVTSTSCAINTSRIKIFSCVTNPVTRHPSVTASALFALDEIAPGRIGLGIGTGDGALFAAGMTKPATIACLKEYVLAVKTLLRGEEVVYQGRSFRAEWRDRAPPKNIPVYITCSGPNVIKMASQVVDGLIVSTRYGPEKIQFVLDIVKEGCAEVGRNPDDLDIWWTIEPIFGASVEESVQENLGTDIGWLALSSLQEEQIPEGYKEPIRTLVEYMYYYTSSGFTAGANLGPMMVQRAKKLGIYDWVISKVPGLWGTPEDMTHRLAELRELGLTNWLFYVGRPNTDRLETINRLAKGVLPNFT